jgi:hypothetical protein
MAKIYKINQKQGGNMGDFKKGDRVEWFEDRYTIIKSYGVVVRVAKLTALVIDQDGYETRVKLRDLNWQ